MLIVLSPAKTLDYETPPTTKKHSEPEFLQRSAQLVEDARALSPADLRELMGISEALAKKNPERFQA